ncbi:MAG TPA: ATP-binding protein [Planctomycetota bacterium]|nr:ATP-binding protein [Planctomycetota bacterium]
MPTDDQIRATVADDLPVGVWVARVPGGEFVYANAMFAEIMGIPGLASPKLGGYSQPYGIHTRTGERYPEDQLPIVRAMKARATVVVDDIVIHRHDGRKVYIRAQAKPLFEGDTMTHVVIAFIDITREVEAERARAESEARLARAQRLESIGRLAGGIAHDFNNLLATIKLVAETLERVEKDPRKKRDLQCIDEVTEHAVRLTNGLLGFAGRGKNLATRLSLDAVVNSMREIIQRTLDRRIVVTFDLRSKSDVLADLSQLEQVVMNLVVNARDAIEGSGAIAVRTRDVVTEPGAKPSVVLEVADTGTGIDPAIRDRIFEPYFTTKTKGDAKGTGLGLATVYGIVQAHGGSIDFADNAPRGTVFSVRLPAVGASPTESAHPSGPRAAVPRGHGKVLLVEDEPLVRAACGRALQEMGYEVLSVADGVEAVEAYRARSAEVRAVILDMVMPRMGGRETYLALREIQPAVPVLLTTGFALNEEAQAILDLGVRGFLAKPYDVDALAGALDRIIPAATPGDR